jgi:Domain of unknown function (DUF4365)
MRYKYRPREHIIADFSVNHFERHALLCGYAVDRVFHDYGFDVVVWTYNSVGEIEPDQLLIQLKATDSLNWVSNQTRIALRVDRRDLTLWLEYLSPIFLILYDAKAEKAYWIYIQAYFQKLGDEFDLSQIGKTYTVYFDPEDILDATAIRKFAEYKQKIASQIKMEGISHEI